MNTLENLRIHIFADGADLDGIIRLYRNPLIKGLTTNPTLMRKAGISDYERFAREVLEIVKSKPISFEIFSDEIREMRRQALKISSWQNNVYVKIPVTNSQGESTTSLVKELTAEGVQVNITAILTLSQVREAAAALRPEIATVVSVFAGRIADTGRQPAPIMRASKALLEHLPRTELLWASVREPLNIFEADECGCHIVTVPHDILNKAMELVNLDLTALSLDTVRMFARDARTAGFMI